MKNFDLKKFIVENKKSVNEIDADLLKRAQGAAPKDAKRREAGDDGLRASMGPNAEQEQKIIDIARDAIALMDEQPGTDAITALETVIEHFEE
jgi:hypothetical protein